MKELKLKLHSIVDLITNSSTVIYTYSHGCDNALRSLFAALKETFNIEENIEDVFYISVLCEDYQYHDYLTDTLSKDDWYNDALEIPKSLADMLQDSEVDYKESGKVVDKIIEDVKYNRIEKPVWMDRTEEHEGSWTYYTPDTYIYLIPKEEKYKKIAEAFNTLIYSTDHEATRDG